jgi:cytosolic phospholipase A2
MAMHLLRKIRQSQLSSLCLAGGYAVWQARQRPRIIFTEAPSNLRWPHTEANNRSQKSNTKISASGKALKTGTSDGDDKAWFGDDDVFAWQGFSNRFSQIGSSICSIQWTGLGNKVTDLLIPSWMQALPEYVRKLQMEVEMAPGSLADEILAESQDSTINPEIEQVARVSIGNALSDEELAFRERRKFFTRRALAKYLDIPEGDIDPQDIPVIAICGSGGGLRALVAGTSSYMSAQEAGLFDCATYTAGVSGSCWLQALYYSSLGKQSHKKILKHLKRRLGIHIAFPPPALKLLTSAPTNKFLLSGLIEKAKGDPDADFGLVDIYGILLAARLLVPRGELEIDPMDLKLSNQRRFIDNGSNPMPLYTMVRHEIPLDEMPSTEAEADSGTERIKSKSKQESWFSWWEMSPYTVWCEEIGAGIPTWGLGRKFQDGVSIPRENGLGLPEMKMPHLLGIWGSAFCATLSHYYKEVKPVLQGIAGFGGIDDLLMQRNDDLVKVHPIDPASIPNFALGLDGQLPETCPKSIFNSSHLKLMDAGMSNNLPIYPLLRPGRDVDVVIAFDASADIKRENWLSVADGYVQQRGIKGWPIGIGWPKETNSQEQTIKELDEAQVNTVDEASQKVEKAQRISKDDDLGYCTVWIGSATERSADAETPPSKKVQPDGDWDLAAGADSGLAVVYFPLLPNPKVPGVDPDKSDFMSTWNFIYTPEEIDKVSDLARANFEEGKDQTKRCVRAIYERKKKLRLEREEAERKEVWRRRWKGHADHFR